MTVLDGRWFPLGAALSLAPFRAGALQARRPPPASRARYLSPVACVRNDPHSVPAAERARVLDHQDDDTGRRVSADQCQCSKAGSYRVWGEVHSPSPAVKSEGLPEPVKSASRPYGMACGHT